MEVVGKKATCGGMTATSVQSTTAEAMAPKPNLEASEAGQENLNLPTKQVTDPSIDENPVR